jgi:REP element-mobilizing transposase RayT
MTYDPDIHHRRSIRLADYDYALEGACFVTVCTEGHLCLLGQMMDDAIHPNEAGLMVRTTWDELPGHSPGVETDAFAIMPNHIHAIIVLSPVGAGPRACPNQTDGMQRRRKRPLHFESRSCDAHPRLVFHIMTCSLLAAVSGTIGTELAKGIVFSFRTMSGRVSQS